jgi:hypothetical protein
VDLVGDISMRLQGTHDDELEQPHDGLHAQVEGEGSNQNEKGAQEQQQAALMVSEARATRLSRYVVEMLQKQLQHQSLIGAPLYSELETKRIRELDVKYVPPRSYIEDKSSTDKISTDKSSTDKSGAIDRNLSIDQDPRSQQASPATASSPSSSNFRHMLLSSSKRIFSRQKTAGSGEKLPTLKEPASADGVDGEGGVDCRSSYRPAKGYEEAPWAREGARVFHARALTAALEQLRALPISGLQANGTDDRASGSIECTFQDVLDLCNEVGIRVYIIGGFLRDYFAQTVDRIADIDLLFAADEGGLRRLYDRAKVTFAPCTHSRPVHSRLLLPPPPVRCLPGACPFARC